MSSELRHPGGMPDPQEPPDHAAAWVTHDDGREYPGWRRSWRHGPDGQWIATADYHAPLPPEEASQFHTGPPLIGHFYRSVPADRIRERDPDETAQPGVPRP
jgi:hypothetical protein